MKLITIALLLLVPFLGSAQGKHKKDRAHRDSTLYRAAVQDAMYPEASKLCDSLVAIKKINKELSWKKIDGEDYVLMVSWKGYIAPYVPYKDTGYYTTDPEWPIWVTASPQLLDRMKELNPKNPDRRLKQLLGLPPNSTYTNIVEFWVRPSDLFRPCPDNEITDTVCELCFPPGTDSTYQAWVDASRISRYYQCELYKQYPWTDMGYTYDWNPRNESHVGLSEFVIKNSVKIKVAGIYTTEQYLKLER